MEQIIQQLNMNEKNNEWLEFDSKVDTILHFYMTMEPEESECSADSAEGDTEVCRSIRKSNEGGQVLIQSLGQKIIDREIFSPRRRRACMSGEMMTIYFYESNIALYNGRPVVLNFTGSDEFLKCMYKDDKADLTVEHWEKDKLKSICQNDKTTWPFVFFLSTMKDNFCRFESAACSGWFIHMGSDLVYASTRLEEKVEENIFSIIYLKSLLSRHQPQ